VDKFGLSWVGLLGALVGCRGGREILVRSTYVLKDGNFECLRFV
jgi:hypothetical protein